MGWYLFCIDAGSNPIGALGYVENNRELGLIPGTIRVKDAITFYMGTLEGSNVIQAAATRGPKLLYKDCWRGRYRFQTKPVVMDIQLGKIMYVVPCVDDVWDGFTMDVFFPKAGQDEVV